MHMALIYDIASWWYATDNSIWDTINKCKYSFRITHSTAQYDTFRYKLLVQ